MPTTPPTIDPAPEVPRRGVKATFGILVDAFNTWFTLAATQIVAMGANVYANAMETFGYATAAGNSASAASLLAESAAASASNAADSATAAGVISGATLWVSGQSVARDAAVISPLDRRTYRRKTATGGGTTDPSIDVTNYVLLSADSSSYIKLAEATIGSAVANVDFLNVFSDAYIRYIVEITGYGAGGAGFNLRMAVAGVVDSAANYFSGGNTSNSAAPGDPTAGTSFTIDIRGARTSTAGKSIIFNQMFPGSVSSSGNVGWSNTALASGFRLFLSSGGNFTAGTIKVYGVRA
ncbi:hypothetical protein [uncultured Massilia sp.]|uniref:hypothetical protein n=1 Tax=uncultured Massilia sp. TaxID=169973 RepID=UPI002589A83F|nr:hypothetical protein [uncultured Massilia sp.]